MRIDTKSGRAALKPRPAPYFHRLRQGFYLGLRCTAAGGIGFWIARRLIGERKYRHKAIGEVSEALDFDAAIKLAEAWASELDRGVGLNTTGRKDVAQACEEYVQALRTEKPGAASDAEMRFKRTVYSHTIARVPLDKLREKHIRDWRDSLELSKASANRTLTALKAALNAAVRSRLAPSQLAFEAKSVQRFKGADGRRDVFLDKAQRKALHDAARGALKDLIEAAALTGARAGELVNAKRSAFDARTGNITFDGKTGRRTVPLSPTAVALFTRLSKDKLPGAYLLTQDDGERWRPFNWGHLMREAVARAQLPKGTVLYSLRHAFISEALLAGMATLTVAKLTGTSLQMIQAHYGHLVSDHAREQLAKVAML